MYTAMINCPGYLPEGDIQQFDLKEDCREFLRDEMRRAMDDAIEIQANVEAIEREYNEASEQLSRHNYAHFLGYYYGIE